MMSERLNKTTEWFSSNWGKSLWTFRFNAGSFYFSPSLPSSSVSLTRNSSQMKKVCFFKGYSKIRLLGNDEVIKLIGSRTFPTIFQWTTLIKREEKFFLFASFSFFFSFHCLFIGIRKGNERRIFVNFYFTQNWWIFSFIYFIRPSFNTQHKIAADRKKERERAKATKRWDE